jgi:hypothetical protein
MRNKSGKTVEIGANGDPEGGSKSGFGCNKKWLNEVF